jgi:hypothetical protein
MKFVFAGGNIRLVAAMAEGLPVMYNSVVREIRYSSSGVAVRTDMHEFAGEFPTRDGHAVHDVPTWPTLHNLRICKYVNVPLDKCVIA